MAVLCLGILLNIPCGFSQEVDTLFFMQKEEMLLEVYENILQADKSQKLDAELIFRDSLFAVLKNQTSFYFPFDTLTRIGRIPSPDGRLVLFTWNIPHGAFHNYYGIIQYKEKKNSDSKLFLLNHKPGKLNQQPQSVSDTSNWHGALYYKIINTKHKGQVYYTLLGFHFNDILSNYKLIDILSFDDNLNPYFPSKKFEYDGKLQNRVIFEYAERVNMTLEYNKDKKLIFFDHLSPMRPSLEGQFQFYGPDFSFDGLKFDNDKWIEKSNIDIIP